MFQHIWCGKWLIAITITFSFRNILVYLWIICIYICVCVWFTSICKHCNRAICLLRWKSLIRNFAFRAFCIIITRQYRRYWFISSQGNQLFQFQFWICIFCSSFFMFQFHFVCSDWIELNEKESTKKTQQNIKECIYRSVFIYSVYYHIETQKKTITSWNAWNGCVYICSIVNRMISSTHIINQQQNI